MTHPAAGGLTGPPRLPSPYDRGSGAQSANLADTSSRAARPERSLADENERLRAEIAALEGGRQETGAMTDPNLVYAYAVLRRTPEAAVAAAELRGVAGDPIHLLEPTDPASPLAFAVGPVPAADYDEAPLEAHLHDLDWLESTVRSHHAVVGALVASGAAVLPLRLATVYPDENHARQALDTRRAYFLSLLDRLTGHVELGVKIYATPDITPPESDTDTEQTTPTGLGVGRAYLAIRRRRQRRNEDAWRTVAQAAAHLTRTAATLAVDRVAHTPQRGSLAGPAPGTNVGNDAYLVAADRVDAFRSGVLAAAEGVPGLRVEVSGPWAPYSFALRPEPVMGPSSSLL